MSEPIEAFPLQWPPGRPRQHCRERAQFKVTMGKSLSDINNEVRLLGGSGLIISTNMPLRRDGMPFAATIRTDSVTRGRKHDREIRKGERRWSAARR